MKGRGGEEGERKAVGRGEGGGGRGDGMGGGRDTESRTVKKHTTTLREKHRTAGSGVRHMWERY
jgi:hypothetical protein